MARLDSDGISHDHNKEAILHVVLLEWLKDFVPDAKEREHIHEFFLRIAKTNKQIASIFKHENLNTSDKEKLLNALLLFSTTQRIATWREINTIVGDEEKTLGLYTTDIVAQMKKEAVRAESLLTEMKLYKGGETEQMEIEDLLLFCFRSYGGEMGAHNTITGDYEIFAQVESGKWWPEVKRILKEKRSPFIEQWERGKQLPLDRCVKQSFGRQGIIGHCLSYFERDTAVEKRGQKKIQSLLKAIERQAKRESRKLPRLQFQIKDGLKVKLTHNRGLPEKIASILNDPIHTETEKLQLSHTLFQELKIKPQDQHRKALYRIEAVEKQEDFARDAKRDLQILNLLLLVGVSLPSSIDVLNKQATVPGLRHPFLNAELLDQIHNNDGDVFDLVYDIAEQQVLNLLPLISPDIILDNLGTVEQFASDGNIAEFLSEISDDSQDSETTLHEQQLLAFYPESLRPDLQNLSEIENPHHQTYEDILNEAVLLYEQRSTDAENFVPAFWQDHPERLNVRDFLTTYARHPSTLELVEALPDNLETIYDESDIITFHYGDVARLYSALHPENESGFTEDSMRAYFADYYQFIFQYSSIHGNRVPPEELLSYAIQRTGGDVHAALWDIAITTKLFTRNDLSSAEFNQSSTSGFLTTEYLYDFMSYGATAHDVAQRLPIHTYPEFWNIEGHGLDGDKQKDPSNLAGQIYHGWTLAAIAGEFPTSTLLGGVISEYLFGSREDFEYGNQRMQDQLRYLMENMSGLNGWIDRHRTNTSVPREQIVTAGEYEVIFQQPFNGHFSAPEDETAIGQLYAGNIISFQQSGVTRFAILRGSQASSYILVGNTLESVSRELSSQAFTSATFSEFFNLQQSLEFQVVSASPIEVRIEPSTPTMQGYIEYRQLLSVNGASSGLLDIQISPEALPFFLIQGDGSNTQFVISHPELFGPLLSDEQFMDLLSSYLAGALIENLLRWEEYRTIDRAEIVRHLKLHSNFWASYVASNPEVFGSFITQSDLPELFSNGGISYFMEHFEEWSQALDLTPESLLATLKETDGIWEQTVFEALDLFYPILTTDDLRHLFLQSYYGNLINYYSTQNIETETRLSPSQILNLIREAHPSDWGYTVLQFPELFSPYLTHQDFPSIIAASGALNIIEHYDSWKDSLDIDQQYLYETLKESQSSWGDIVTQNPEFFATTVHPDDLIPIAEHQGLIGLVSNFSIWQPIFDLSIPDLENLLDVHDSYYLRDQYPEIFNPPDIP